MSDPASNRSRWVFGAILAVTALVMGRTLTHELLAWDDDVNIVANPLVRQGVVAGWRDYQANPVTRAYPLSALMWGLLGHVNRAVGKPAADPFPYHTAGWLLHLACTALVWRLLAPGRLLPVPDTATRSSLWARAAGTALFAWHPLQVEAVAWATASKDQLSVLFCLLAMQARMDRRDGWRGQVHSLFFLVLAMLAKPTAGILAPAMAMADLFGAGVLKRESYRRIWLEHRLWLIPALVGLAILKATQPDQAMPYVPAVGLRFLGALDAVAFYVRRLFVPLDLSVLYGRTPLFVAGLPTGAHLANLAVVVLFVVGVGWAGGRAALRALGAAGVILTPALGLVPFHFQVNYSTVADRYLYLPMVMLAWMVAAVWGLPRHGHGHGVFRWGRLALATALALGAIGSRRRLADWRDNRTLFESVRVAAAQHPVGDVALAQGTALVQLAADSNNRGRPVEAETLAREALALQPLNREALIALAFSLNAQGRYQETMAVLQPLGDQEPTAYWACMARAVAMLSSGAFKEARDCLDVALRIRPYGHEARQMRERLRLAMGL